MMLRWPISFARTMNKSRKKGGSSSSNLIKFRRLVITTKGKESSGD